MAGPKKKTDEPVSWALIILLFGLGIWPIGLVLLFAKLFGSDEKKGMSSSRTTRSTAGTGTRKTTAARASRAAKSVTRQPKMKKSNARLLQIIGGILLFASAVSIPEYLGWVLAGEMLWLSDLLQMIALGAAGGGMFVAGRRMSAAMKRYARYLAVMGGRGTVSMNELSRKLGYAPQQVENDLKKMIDKDYFGAAAYYNEELEYFFCSAQAEEEMAEEKAAKAAQAAAQETEKGFSGILRDIRRANDRIADPVLSEQIERLEDITGRIFRAVEENPEKRSQIGTFLNYYLPTTQKLLASYAEFEAAGVEGENLRQAKESIRRTMQSIVVGFEHQLDALYRADAMDVDKDIRVMETMLRRDTASVEKDFGLRDSGRRETGKAVGKFPENCEEDTLYNVLKTVEQTAVHWNEGTAVSGAAAKTADVDLGGVAAQQMEE